MSPRWFARSPSRPSRTIALAGAGSIAVVHALAAQAAGMRVRSVASAGGRSARHLAGELDARRVAPDALPDGADLLVVATPPAAHAALARQGAEAGAHVLVEKPLCVTLAEADALVELAAERPSAAMRCAENLLHAPLWREWRRRRPSLGTLGHLSARAMQPSPDWGHFSEPLTAGGVLFDLGPHPVALVLDAAGEPPVSVAAELSSGREDGADDHASVWIGFGSGLVASVEVSWRNQDVVWEVQAAGPTGVLRLEVLPELRLEHDGDPVPAPPDRFDAADPLIERLGYVDQLLDIVESSAVDRAVDGATDRAVDSPTGQSMHSAREVLEVIAAAYASAGVGTPVELPFDGPRDATPMQLWSRSTSS